MVFFLMLFRSSATVLHLASEGSFHRLLCLDLFPLVGVVLAVRIVLAMTALFLPLRSWSAALLLLWSFRRRRYRLVAGVHFFRAGDLLFLTNIFLVSARWGSGGLVCLGGYLFRVVILLVLGLVFLGFLRWLCFPPFFAGVG